MKPSDPTLNQYPLNARLFELINHISEEQFIIILKELLKDNFSAHLFKLVIDMSEPQQAALLKQLQKKVEGNDRRRYARKPCLIPLTYAVQGRQFDGYILDISDHGAFIETGNVFYSGQEIIITFSAPQYQKPLTISGEIVWSSQNGIGVKFSPLTSHQNKAVQAFSDNKAEVVKIRS